MSWLGDTGIRTNRPNGTPVVLLAGGGNTAHVFDDFAPKLTTDHYVYGITRRGFGASGFSTAENAVDRLRDDVLDVIDALKLKRPVLVGHSIAGAELSAVATANPDRVSALVYLEAGYPYAFDNGQGPTMSEFQASGPRLPGPSESDLASFSSLQTWDAEVFGFRKPEAEFRHTWDSDSLGRPRKPRDFPGSQLFAVIMTKRKKYTAIPVPALMIFAIPHIPEMFTSPRLTLRQNGRRDRSRLPSLLRVWSGYTPRTICQTKRIPCAKCVLFLPA